MTGIKICGLKQIEHVQTAIASGATMIGFVFAESKRKITIEQAKQLAQVIPPSIKKVGVFVNAPKSYLHEVYNEVGLDYIQFHGDESPSFIEEVDLPSIKAFSVQHTFDFDQLQAYSVDYFLLDAPRGQYYGGNGTSFDWHLLQNAKIDSTKVIVAGGLTPENVTEAIRQTNPFAVDVSSGVEIDGTKDSKRIQQFIETVKGAYSHE